MKLTYNLSPQATLDDVAKVIRTLANLKFDAHATKSGSQVIISFNVPDNASPQEMLTLGGLIQLVSVPIPINPNPNT